MNRATISDLLGFLAHLKSAHLHYTISDPTEGAVMVEISVPGGRWEVEFHEDGRISVEEFVSRNGVQGPDSLDDLFRRFSN